MNTSITITTPEIALFDKTYLEQSEETGLTILSADELANSCSVDEAEQGTLDIIHSHFHPALLYH